MDKARAYKWFSELVGKSVGGWTIDELLGYGKSAIVVKACRGPESGALKLFDPELIEGFGRATQLQRIEREKLLIGKQLPNLIRVIDGGKDDPLLFVVMEYLPPPWRPLSEYLQEFPRDAIWPLISKISKAARALESVGLAHRDIKPENIMVQPDFNEVRLLDLGVLRPIGGSDITDEASRPFIGTLRYSSPEYLLREEKDTVEGWRALTFYQLGGVLHDLIVRRPLFADYSEPYARLVKAVQEQIPGVEAEDVHISLLQLCNNCLLKRADIRLKCVGWPDFELPNHSVENEADAARDRVKKRNLIASQALGEPLQEDQTQREMQRERDTLRESLQAGIRQIAAGEFPPVTFSDAMSREIDRLEFSISFGPSLRHGVATQVRINCTVVIIDVAAHVCEIVFSTALQADAEPVSTQLLTGVYEQEVVRVRMRDFLYVLIDKYQEG